MTTFVSQAYGCGDRTWTCDLRVMRNLRFVRYSAVLLGLVVLRTKAQNGFCPMCTKGCCIVLNRSNPFWGQFWGQICETDSHTHRFYKYAALVSLRNMNTRFKGFLRRKSPTNRWWNFTLYTEVVRKHYSTPSPHTAPVTARSAPVWARSHRVGAVLIQPNIASKSPLSGDFLPQRHLPRRDFPVQVNPTQINN